MPKPYLQFNEIVSSTTKFYMKRNCLNKKNKWTWLLDSWCITNLCRATSVCITYVYSHLITHTRLLEWATITDNCRSGTPIHLHIYTGIDLTFVSVKHIRTILWKIVFNKDVVLPLFRIWNLFFVEFQMCEKTIKEHFETNKTYSAVVSFQNCKQFLLYFQYVRISINSLKEIYTRSTNIQQFFLTLSKTFKYLLSIFICWYLQKKCRI